MILHTSRGDFVAHFKYTEEPAIVIPKKFRNTRHWQDQPLMQKVVICIIHKGETCERDESGICVVTPWKLGKTWCSLTDPFVHVAGRKIAFERAISHLTREDRIDFWAAYKYTAKYIVPKPNVRIRHAKAGL